MAVKILFNPFAFPHEQNMEFLAKGYEPDFRIPSAAGKVCKCECGHLHIVDDDA